MIGGLMGFKVLIIAILSIFLPSVVIADGLPTMGNAEEIIEDWSEFTSDESLGEGLVSDDTLRVCTLTAEDLAPTQAQIDRATEYLNSLVTSCSEITARSYSQYLNLRERKETYRDHVNSVEFHLIPNSVVSEALAATVVKAERLTRAHQRQALTASQCDHRESVRWQRIFNGYKTRVRVSSRFDYRCRRANSDEGGDFEVHPDTGEFYVCTASAEQWEQELQADPESDEFVAEVTQGWVKARRSEVFIDVTTQFRQELAPEMTNDEFHKEMYRSQGELRRLHFRRYNDVMTRRYETGNLEQRTCDNDVVHQELPVMKCSFLESEIRRAI